MANGPKIESDDWISLLFNSTFSIIYLQPVFFFSKFLNHLFEELIVLGNGRIVKDWKHFDFP